MPGTLLVPAGLGGVAARLEVILEEMLEVRGLPTGRMPSTSCNERVKERHSGRAAHGQGLEAGAGWGRREGCIPIVGRLPTGGGWRRGLAGAGGKGASQLSPGCPQHLVGRLELDRGGLEAARPTHP